MAAETRIAGDGIICTISGNVLTFPYKLHGPYGTSNYVYNITKGETKAITALTAVAGHTNVFGDVTVASIGTWVSTDFYALVLDTTPTQHAFLSTALAAASAGDEVVAYPFYTMSGSTILNLDAFHDAPVSTINVKIRSWSLTSRAIIPGQILYSTSNIDVTYEGFMYRPTGLGVRFNGDPTNCILRFKQMICEPTAPTAFNGAAAGSGCQMHAESCYAEGSSTEAPYLCNDSDVSFFVNHCGGASMDRAYRRISGTFTVKNCWGFKRGSSGGTDRFLGTFDAASDYNATSHGAVPGVNSLTDSQVPAWIFTRDRSPLNSANTEGPEDFRTLLDGILEKAGAPVGIIADINGRTLGTGAAGSATAPSIGHTQGLGSLGSVVNTLPVTVSVPDMRITANVV